MTPSLFDDIPASSLIQPRRPQPRRAPNAFATVQVQQRDNPRLSAVAEVLAAVYTADDRVTARSLARRYGLTTDRVLACLRAAGVTIRATNLRGAA
jgi:hypothetical protein